MKRKLSESERALWRRVAATVDPLNPHRNSLGEGDHAKHGGGAQAKGAAIRRSGKPSRSLHQPAAGPAPLLSLSKGGEERRTLDRHGLDAGWDRRLAKGQVHPDFTLDLHGASLEAAHGRLDHGLTLALAQGARLVLVITGLPRGGEHGGRGERRGAIRAKLLDWLAAGSHASRIAAVRPAHPRHGGAGAVYLVLKRGR